MLARWITLAIAASFLAGTPLLAQPPKTPSVPASPAVGNGGGSVIPVNFTNEQVAASNAIEWRSNGRAGPWS